MAVVNLLKDPVRRLRRQGQSQLAARHPTRIRAAASGPVTGAALICLVGLLLAMAVVAFARDGWDLQRENVTTAQRVLVPVLLVQLSLSGAIFLAHRTLPRPVHKVLTGLWLLPLAVTALMVGGAGRSADGRVLFVWGVFGLALTLWVTSHYSREPLALILCYSGPLVLLAVWSAAGSDHEATETAALALTILAAASVAAVPGVLVARAVSDLPRVHRWASDAERWFAGRPVALLWLVGAKSVALMVYLAFVGWRFPELNFVPGNAPQWGMAVAGALFLIVPMRMARSRTLDETRVRLLAATVGVVIGAVLALIVPYLIGWIIWSTGSTVGSLTLVLLFGAAVAASRSATWSPKRRAAAVLLTPFAVLAGFLVPLSDPPVQSSAEVQLRWLAGLVAGTIALLVVGAIALQVAGKLTWRYAELWWVIRAAGFISLWVVLVTLLRKTGIGLAGVDIALTVMLVGASAWITRHPRSRLAALEVLALCALPAIVIYGPDLLAGAPAATQPWFAAAALAVPGATALWHHLGLDGGQMSAKHSAGLAGLGALYGMVGGSILLLGSTYIEAVPLLANTALDYLVLPLSILFIAILEARSPPGGFSSRPRAQTV